jgi:hypothetical protein
MLLLFGIPVYVWLTWRRHVERRAEPTTRVDRDEAFLPPYDDGVRDGRHVPVGLGID